MEEPINKREFFKEIYHYIPANYIPTDDILANYISDEEKNKLELSEKNTPILYKIQKTFINPPKTRKEKFISSYNNTLRLSSFIGTTEALLDVSKETLVYLKDYLSQPAHVQFKAGIEDATFVLGSILEYIAIFKFFRNLNDHPYHHTSKLAEGVMRATLHTQSAAAHIMGLLASAGIVHGVAGAVFSSMDSFSFGVSAWAQVGLSIFKLQNAVKKNDMNYWINDQINKYNVIAGNLVLINENFEKINSSPHPEKNKKIKKLEKRKTILKAAQDKITHRLNVFYKVYNDQPFGKIELNPIQTFFEDKKLNLETSIPTPEEKKLVENFRSQQQEKVLGNSADLVFKTMMAIGATFMSVSPLCPPLLIAGSVLVSAAALLSMATYLVPKITDAILKKQHEKEVLQHYSSTFDFTVPDNLSPQQKAQFFALKKNEKIYADMAYSLLSPEEKTPQKRLGFYKELFTLTSKERTKFLEKAFENYAVNKTLQEKVGANYQEVLSSEKKLQQKIYIDNLREKKLGRLCKPFSFFNGAGKKFSSTLCEPLQRSKLGNF